MIPFCKRYPERSDNITRDRTNGPVRLGKEPVGESLRKIMKTVLGARPIREIIFSVALLLERVAPDSLLLDRIYRLLLGIYILRGYRQGLRQFGTDCAGQKIQPVAFAAGESSQYGKG